MKDAFKHLFATALNALAARVDKTADALDQRHESHLAKTREAARRHDIQRRGLKECVSCSRALPAARFPSYAYSPGEAPTPVNPDSIYARTCRDCESHPRPLTATEQETLERFIRFHEECETQTPGAPTGADFLTDPHLRQRHLYIIGKSGSGKTTLLKHLALRDLHAGAGLCFIDPHGDAVDDLLAQVPEERFRDLIYFAPATHPVAFNVLALPYRPDKLAADVVSLFRMFFESWGPQLEMILANALISLVADRDQEPHSLADLRRLLVDEDYRETITARLSDETLRSFWQRDFTNLARTAINPVLNKLDAFLRPYSPLARLFSSPANDLDFTRILNERKILLANLSKGELGDEPSRLLGGMLATGIQQAALARVSIPEAQRVPFNFYVDEFQNYTVSSFETILSEARKYALTLTLANQTLGQLPASLRDSIFGNVGTLVSFVVSADDAAHLKKEMRGRRTVWGDGTLWDPAAAFRQQRQSLHAQAVKLKNSIHDRLDGRAAARSLVPHVPKKIADRDVGDLLSDMRRWLDNTIQIYPPAGVERVEWPRTHDLVTLRRGAAIARVLQADDVRELATPPPPPADHARKARVLAAIADRQTSRSQILDARGEPLAAPEHNPSASTPAPPPVKKKPPKDDDDFGF